MQQQPQQQPQQPQQQKRKQRIPLKSLILINNFFEENKDLGEITIVELIGLISAKTNITLTKQQLRKIMNELGVQIKIKSMRGLNSQYRNRITELENKMEYLELLIKETESNMEKKILALRGLMRENS